MSRQSPITISQPGKRYSHSHPNHKFHTNVPTVALSQTNQPNNAHNIVHIRKIHECPNNSNFPIRRAVCKTSSKPEKSHECPNASSIPTNHYSQYRKNFSNVPIKRAMFKTQKQKNLTNVPTVSNIPTNQALILDPETTASKIVNNVPAVPLSPLTL